MKNSLVISFIILLTYLSQMSPSKANCPTQEGINIKDSFGIQICSMPGVDNKYLLHAKNVMDNLLDYDGDEFPDNQLVIENIMRTGSVFVVFNNEGISIVMISKNIVVFIGVSSNCLMV